MTKQEFKETLAEYVAYLNEQETLSLVRRRLENGDNPLKIIGECQVGMRRVGELYEREEYFISGLIMAGEIFRQVMDLIRPVVKESMSGEGSGRVLLGTVQGDIHNLGKDMVADLLICHGFRVHDLGVNVPPESFVEEAQRLHPDIIGLSILITNALDSMRKTIALLKNVGMNTMSHIPIIIGGSLPDDAVCKHVEADYWVNDAMEGVRLCLKLVAEKNP